MASGFVIFEWCVFEFKNLFYSVLAHREQRVPDGILSCSAVQPPCSFHFNRYHRVVEYEWQSIRESRELPHSYYFGWLLRGSNQGLDAVHQDENTAPRSMVLINP